MSSSPFLGHTVQYQLGILKKKQPLFREHTMFQNEDLAVPATMVCILKKGGPLTEGGLNYKYPLTTWNRKKKKGFVDWKPSGLNHFQPWKALNGIWMRGTEAGDGYKKVLSRRGITPKQGCTNRRGKRRYTSDGKGGVRTNRGKRELPTRFRSNQT